MDFRFSFLAILLLSFNLSAQVPTIRTFIGNGRTDTPDMLSAVRGIDVSSYALSPLGVSVDQAGNVSIGTGNVIRVTSAARFLYAVPGTVLVAETVATSPIGTVIAARKTSPCFIRANPPILVGFIFRETFGNCTGEPQDSGDGGPLTRARFNKISGIGIDYTDGIYIYDEGAQKLRYSGPDGQIRSIATNVRLASGSGDQPALYPAHPSGGILALRISDDALVRYHPNGFEVINVPDFSVFRPYTLDLAGNFYYFRSSDRALVRRAPNGSITIIGLNGQINNFTEGMPAASLNYQTATGIAADTSGNIYLFEGKRGFLAPNTTDFRLFRITIPGTYQPPCSFSLGPATLPSSAGPFSLTITANSQNCFWSLTSSDFWLSVPSTIQRGSGNISITLEANPNPTERRATILLNGQSFSLTQSASTNTAPELNGIIETFAGDPRLADGRPLTSPIPVRELRFGNPREIAFDSQGNLLVVDAEKSQVLRLSLSDNTVSAIAGTGAPVSEPSGYGGPATSARLLANTALAIDSADNIYTASGSVIQRFRLGGTFERVSDGPGGPRFIGSTYDSFRNRFLFGGANGLYELRGNTLALLSARTPTNPSLSGVALSTVAASPRAIVTDREGNIYYSDTAENMVWRVSPTGIRSLFAGIGSPSSTGDGLPPSIASIYGPLGLAFDAQGALYIADTFGGRIRRVSGRIIQTIAGNGSIGNSGDGGLARNASIFPEHLAFAPNGDLFFTSGSAIRRIRFPRSPASISRGGVINLSGGALSPGGLFSIYGSSLAATTAAASSSPLPTVLAGVSVLVNGSAVPLSFVSPTQINAQMPVTLSPGPATLAIRSSAGTSETTPIDLVAAAPAILEYGNRRAVATSPSALLNSPSDPAAPGDAVVVYLTGIGPVDPPAATGAAAPSDQLSNASLTASATIGGEPATILFLGLAPGFVGLAQANILVPAIPAGDHPLEITIADRKSNSPLLAIR